ncbi:alpha-1,2-fucosyltransferase [Chitinophaga varians]|uniref:alpha-1,2-fucosyltransferase n=1 Tax=Chitinophaga varians TaxID=2202339 RepID=UPI00165F759D|nr:alpha-1,2-fucosyltransferase [Chitinophaga varians]MBC9911138.1 alpha-1,2-fucosyltransferase [Chitinophaga varians]
MVVLTKLYGQTSNNFLQFIHLDSFCREHNIPFHSPYFRKYFKHYPALQEYGVNYSKVLMKFFIRTRLYKVLSFADIEQIPFYKDMLRRKKRLFCEGWYFESKETAFKNRKLYQRLFTPDIDQEPLQQQYLKKQNNETIIGVHIRRGDYKEFLNGQYYFEDDVYIDKIKQLLSGIDTPHKIIIFSNDEALNKANYTRHFNAVFSDNPVHIDHFLMSRCDYLIGPVSTFTMWASYIGETPLYHIRTAGDVVSPDKFKIFDENWF